MGAASLCLDHSRGDEEDQFLVRALHRLMLEEVTEPRNAAEQRNLLNRYGIARLDDAADDHRSAIGDQDLRGRLLGDQSRVALNVMAEVGRRIFHVHVEEDRILGRDLRNHRQPQKGVHVGDRGRPI